MSTEAAIHWVPVLQSDDGQGLNPAGCQLFSYEEEERDGQIYLAVPTAGRRYNRCRE